MQNYARYSYSPYSGHPYITNVGVPVNRPRDATNMLGASWQAPSQYQHYQKPLCDNRSIIYMNVPINDRIYQN